MKKFLIFGVMIGVLILVIGSVMADTQTLEGGVGNTMSFTLLDNALSFGTIAAGSSSALIQNRIQVNAINNIAFHLGIQLTSDTNGLFSGNLVMDTDENVATPGVALTLLGTSLDVIMPDPTGDAIAVHDLKAQLNVPSGFSPIGSATGTVTYTITGPSP